MSGHAIIIIWVLALVLIGLMALSNENTFRQGTNPLVIRGATQ